MIVWNISKTLHNEKYIYQYRYDFIVFIEKPSLCIMDISVFKKAYVYQEIGQLKKGKRHLRDRHLY